MKGSKVLAATAAGVVAAIMAVPAQAQDYPNYAVDIGLNGGASWYSNSLDEDHLGSGQEAGFESGFITGAQLTFWPSPRIGIRGNLAYSERPFDSDGTGDVNLVDDVNLWGLTGDLMFRFTDPSNSFIPYLALGLGKFITNPAGDVNVKGGETGAVLNAGNNNLALMEGSALAGLLGLGADMRVADNFAFRLELTDRISDSSIEDVTIADEEDVGKVIHQVSATLGAHLLLGLDRPQVVAIEPAPPAPPAPEREPEPEPEPRRDIAVCVIDPTSPDGIRIINATYFPERRDTVVMVNGMERSFTGEVPRLMVASRADWFVRGEPLTLTLDRSRTAEFTTWQRGRVIDRPGELTFLGNVRGLPVYASSSDVQDIREELREANRVEPGDLDRMIEEREDLREDLDDIEFLYVPLETTGCVFQAVQRIEEVRKKDN